MANKLHCRQNVFVMDAELRRDVVAGDGWLPKKVWTVVGPKFGLDYYGLFGAIERAAKAPVDATHRYAW